MNASTKTSRVWIGLDVGGTKIEGAAVDDGDGVLGWVRQAMDATSAESAVESIVRALRATMAAAGISAAQVAGIGLGIPGMVQDGVVSLAVNLNLTAFPLAGYLAEVFKVPIYLENDVRAAALGAFAWVREQLPEVNSLVYLSIGTGISCGVVLDGRLHRGIDGMAGEIGHAIVDPGGDLCRCGSRGCLETIASGTAIARQAERALAAGQSSLLGEISASDSALTAEHVFAAARAGDCVAQAVVQRAASAVAQAIYNLLMTYNVELVALGGGVAQAGDVFFAPLNLELDRFRAVSPLARRMLAGPGAAPGPWSSLAGPLPGSKIILLPRDAVPAWRGMIVLAKGMGA